MSFLGSIASAIGGGLKTLFGIGSSVIGGISGVIEQTGIATLLSTITTLTNNIGDMVTGFADAFDGIISPIKDVVDSVKELSDTIEDRIIAPIVRPVVDTITEVKALTGNIERLIDQGLSGIIDIPKTVANALTSVEAQWAASAAKIAAAQRVIVTEEMIPGIKQAVAPGLEGIQAELKAFTKNLGLNVDNTGTIDLSYLKADEMFLPIAKAFQEGLNNPQTLIEKISFAAVNVINFFIMTLSQMSAQLDDGVDRARAANPTKKFGPTEALQLWQRKIISTSDLYKEMAYSGYNDTRIKALQEGMAFLPSPAEVIDWAFKSIITPRERDDVLAKHGYSEAAAQATVASSHASIAEDTLLTWLAKGFITREEVIKKLKGKGIREEDIARMFEDALQDPQVNTTINWHWNIDAARSGWFTETYASLPPQDVIDAARIARIDPTETTRRWQSQFSAMPVSTAITLFFRGELARRDVETVVAQNGFPRGMTEHFIKAQAPLIPTRSIPTLVAKREISIAEGMKRLEDRGYNTTDAALLLEGAKQDLEDEAAAPQTEQTKITAAQARTAYRNGAITRDDLAALLSAIGFSEADIEFNIALEDWELAKDARESEIATVKAEVASGALTIDEGIDRLFSLGLAEPEVTRVAASFKQAKRAAAKVPDLGLLRQLASKSIITADDFLYGVRALGYTDGWDEAIAELQFGAGAGGEDADTDETNS